ncbi:MAG: hypothetical protein J6R38_02505 [Alistipes sp.]|nr:hypothetical protein [Alistipes sp.]
MITPIRIYVGENPNLEHSIFADLVPRIFDHSETKASERDIAERYDNINKKLFAIICPTSKPDIHTMSCREIICEKA